MDDGPSFTTEGANAHQKEPPPPEFRLTEAEFLAWLEEWKDWGWHLARKHWFRWSRGRWASLEEVHAMVVEGFWQATRLFDKRRGTQFSTYASWWARQSVQRAMFRIMGLKPHHFEPEYAEIKQRVLRTASLDAPRNMARGDAGKLADTVADHRAVDDGRQRWPDDFWERVAKVLDPRYYRVIEMRFRQDMTLEEVGAVIGVTKERIRQLEVKALKLIHSRVDFGDCQEHL